MRTHHPNYYKRSSQGDKILSDLRRYSYAYVNNTLIVINILVFALCIFTGQVGAEIYNRGSLITGAVTEGHEYWRLVTPIFMHAGVQHLGSNMLAQLLLGNIVERNVGHAKYLALYLVSGICGNICSVLYELSKGEYYRSVGASGAIYGIMGAVVVIIMKGRKQLRQGSSLILRAGLMVAYAVYSGLQTPYINNAAHLGGMAAGLLIGIFMMLGMGQVDLQDLGVPRSEMPN